MQSFSLINKIVITSGQNAFYFCATQNHIKHKCFCIICWQTIYLRRCLHKYVKLLDQNVCYFFEFFFAVLSLNEWNREQKKNSFCYFIDCNHHIECLRSFSTKDKKNECIFAHISHILTCVFGVLVVRSLFLSLASFIFLYYIIFELLLHWRVYGRRT